MGTITKGKKTNKTNKKRIRQALDDANHDVAAAAKALNMKEAALERKIKKWGWQEA